MQGAPPHTRFWGSPVTVGALFWGDSPSCPCGFVRSLPVYVHAHRTSLVCGFMRPCTTYTTAESYYGQAELYCPIESCEHVVPPSCDETYHGTIQYDDHLVSLQPPDLRPRADNEPRRRVHKFCEHCQVVGPLTVSFDSSGNCGPRLVSCVSGGIVWSDARSLI